MKSTYFWLYAFLFWLGYLTPGLGQSRWAISVNLAPTYAFGDFKEVFPFPDANIPGSTSTELLSQSHTWGYSFGLMGHFQLSAKWSASAGIWAVQYTAIKGNLTLDRQKAAINYSNKHLFEYGYRVPVLVNYQSSSKRLSPYFSAGVSVNFRGTSYYTLNGVEIPIKLGPPVVFTPLLGIGAIYQLSAHVSVLIQPMIHYDVRARPTYVYYHSYPLSLQTQLKYRF